MAQTIRSARQKLANGSYSDPIPFGADAKNIKLINGYDLDEALGRIDVANNGNVQAQLDKHTQDITANKISIDNGNVEIANLQSRVSINETKISTNELAIEDNAANIQKNAQDILVNAQNISSNDTDILNLQSRVEKNENDIGEHYTLIQTNISDIDMLKNKTTVNETNITTNTSNIERLDSRISEEVEVLNSNIQSIEGAFSGDLSGLTTRVGNNEKAINENARNIEALQEKDIEVQAIITNHGNNIDELISTTNTHTTDIANAVTKIEAAPFVKGIEYNGSTYTFTFTKYDNSVQTIELPFENLIERGYYDTETEEIVLVLSTKEEVRIPAANLVDDYTGKDGAQIKTSVVNNIIEATIKANSIDETFLSTDIQTTLTSMKGMYTKAEIDALLAGRSEFVEIDTW